MWGAVGEGGDRAEKKEEKPRSAAAELKGENKYSLFRGGNCFSMAVRSKTACQPSPRGLLSICFLT